MISYLPTFAISFSGFSKLLFFSCFRVKRLLKFQNLFTNINEITQRNNNFITHFLPDKAYLFWKRYPNFFFLSLRSLFIFCFFLYLFFLKNSENDTCHLEFVPVLITSGIKLDLLSFKSNVNHLNQTHYILR